MYLKIIAQTGAYIKQKINFLAVIASSLASSLFISLSICIFEFPLKICLLELFISFSADGNRFPVTHVDIPCAKIYDMVQIYQKGAVGLEKSQSV